MRDQTDKTARSAAQSASEDGARLQALVEIVADFYWELDEDTNVKWVSQAFTGWLKELNVDFIGMPIAHVVGEMTSLCVVHGGWEKVLESIKARQPYNDLRVFLQMPGMDRLDLSCSSIPVFDEAGTYKGVRGAAIDISRRIAGERNLHLQSVVLQGMDDGVVIVADDGTVVDVNPAYCKIFELEPEQVIGLSGEEIFSKFDFQNGNLDLILQSLDQRGHWDQEFSIRLESGEKKSLTGVGFLLYPGNSQDRARVTILCDITARKQAEDRLIESEGRLRDVVATSTDLIWETDAEGRFTYISEWAGETAAISRSRILGRTMPEQVADLQSSTGAVEMHQKVMQREPFTNHLSSMMEVDRKTSHWSSNGAPFYSTDGTYAGFRGLSRDITEQVNAAEQLRQSQRMEAVGQLTGGVAHDFNNILMSMQLNLEFLEPLIPKDGEGPEFLQSLISGINRAAELTQRLLAFSRQQVLQPMDTDVNQQIEGLVGMLERTLGEDVEIETFFTQQSSVAKLDPGQLESAVLNLSLNARHAMPKGGKLTIRTEVKILSASDTAGQTEARPGKHLMVSVSDSGGGMTPAIKAQVFEPFFTTKDVGEGSGLGLSMVHGFVTQSQGMIEIESLEGVGTTVTMYFPQKD